MCCAAEADKVKQAQAVSLGGHTVTSQELMYGLAVTGVVHRRIGLSGISARNRAMRWFSPKRLGVGILTTGLKFNKISESVLPEIVESMARLNASASEVMQKAQRPCLHGYHRVRSARARF